MPRKFKKLNLEKEMYGECEKREITFSQLLEELDPSENYPNVKLDAFERQLAVRGLTVKGPKSVSLAEFYDPNNIVLFPEFIDREVRAGRMLGKNQAKVLDLTAITTEIDAGTYQSAYLDMTQDFDYKPVGELSEFPALRIKIDNKSIDLRKYGFKLVESYEHARRIRANKFATFLRIVGQNLEKAMVAQAIDVLINGNPGNNNAAFAFAATGLTYNNLVDFWAEFDPYESSIMVLPKAGITALLKLSEFKDAFVGFDFQRTGNLITPLGNQLRRYDTTLLTNKVLAVDAEFSLELVTERGANLTEAERIISNQSNQIVISQVFAFSKIFGPATGVWDYT